MTRHRIAQIAEKVNPKSPEIRPQEGRFLQNRLLHRPHWLTQRQSVRRSSQTTSEVRVSGPIKPDPASTGHPTVTRRRQFSRKPIRFDVFSENFSSVKE